MIELGWLDTNIFIHALYRNDPFYHRCRAIITALENDEARGWIDPLVVHELTYVLGRQPQFRGKEDVHLYIRAFLLRDQIRADDKQALIDALTRWATSTVSFADAWLFVLASRRDSAVCSVNRSDFPNLRNTFLEFE